jgi:hypothetical protein
MKHLIFAALVCAFSAPSAFADNITLISAVPAPNGDGPHKAGFSCSISRNKVTREGLNDMKNLREKDATKLFVFPVLDAGNIKYDPAKLTMSMDSVTFILSPGSTQNPEDGMPLSVYAKVKGSDVKFQASGNVVEKVNLSVEVGLMSYWLTCMNMQGTVDLDNADVNVLN